MFSSFFFFFTSVPIYFSRRKTQRLCRCVAATPLQMTPAQRRRSRRNTLIKPFSPSRWQELRNLKVPATLCSATCFRAYHAVPHKKMVLVTFPRRLRTHTLTSPLRPWDLPHTLESLFHRHPPPPHLVFCTAPPVSRIWKDTVLMLAKQSLGAWRCPHSTVAVPTGTLFRWWDKAKSCLHAFPLLHSAFSPLSDPFFPPPPSTG